MQVGDVIGGFDTQDGVHLHIVKAINGETTEIEIRIFEPDDPQFSWAVRTLAQINAS